MKISAVIPVYNGARHLQEAIESVLSQDRQPDEIIAIDDGSTDNTPEIIASFGDALRAHRQENRGPSAARNAGLRIASGDAIAFLDHDNLWPKGRLSEMETSLESQPAAEILAGLVEMQDQRDGADASGAQRSLATAHRLNQIDSLLIRRSVFDKTGLFDEALRHGEDIAWYLKAREQNMQFYLLSSVTVIYRLHASNTSHDREDSRDSLLKVMQQSLSRRRGGR